MKARPLYYTWLWIVFYLCTQSLHAQTTQSLQVGIISHAENNRFCEGIPEWFTLEAKANGGTEPYYFEWTFTFRDDTLHDQTISVRPETSGEVMLRVTDSSHPSKSKDVKYRIFETIIDVDFTFSPDNSCAQTPVEFNPVVSGGAPDYHYYWYFGDGYNSYERNPEHEFISSGCSGISSFNVYMSVTDADGCSAHAEKAVTVKKKPFLDFIDTENPFSPFKHCPEIMVDPTFDIVLENRSQDVSCISSYKIDWGDGTIDEDASFPIRHTYTKVGAFELVITAENSSGCDLTWIQYVYNQSSPAVGIESYGGTEGCAPVEFTFGLVGYENNSIGTTYTWNFGDGTPPVVWDYDDPYANDTINHVYRNSSCGDDNYWLGYFITYVTVENGCDTKTASVDKVRVWSNPEASINYGDLTIDTICTNETIQLTNESENGYYGSDCISYSEYKWDFNNGITSDSEEMPPMSWSIPGEYDIVLDVSNPCGTGRDTFKIIVIEPPLADAIVDDTAGCVPFVPKFENNSTGSTEYLWNITPDSGYTFLNGTSEESMD